MKIETFEVGSYAVNCSIVSDGAHVWIVDPGSEGERIVEKLQHQRLQPMAALLTHAHFDHISGLPALQRAFPGLPVYVHAADIPFFGHPFNQMPGEYASIGVPDNLRPLDGDRSCLPTEWGFSVIHTPGHTPGGVCYLLDRECTLFTGDTLFSMSCGRTDFPGGDMQAMLDSLKRLSQLDEKLKIIPGHGECSTIGREKAGNPYMLRSL